MKVDKSNPRHWAILLVQGCYALLGVFYRFIAPAAARPTVVFYGHQYAGKKTRAFQCCAAILADMLTVARAAIMITDHGLHALIPFLRLTNITFIDVWHGIPFKGYTPKDFSVLHAYDENHDIRSFKA